MVIYVDDFKIAGPKEALPRVWELLRQGLKIGPEGPAAHFLGCTHERGSFTLANGTEVTSMTYNMEPFLRSCVDLYLSLSRERGFQSNLRDVATPFIAEDHAGSPQGAPCGDGPAVFCPECRHAFPMSQSVSDAEHRATMRKLAEAVSNPVPEASGPSGLPGPTASAAAHEKSRNQSAVGGADVGQMGPIAAKVLMKVAYAARYARFDLQRAVNHLACFVTKWDADCDRKLHRLMCYVHSSYHLRLVG